MRNFILHTSDKSKSFDLNGNVALAAEPKGLGNSFGVSYKDSENGKHVVNIKPEFEPITLKIYFNTDGTNGYVNYKNLLSFLAVCGTSEFLFEYADGVTDKFCDVVLKAATKSEINEDGMFVEDFTFERQTYWYEQVGQAFCLDRKDDDAVFPMQFPFGFAGIVFTNEYKVKNAFFVSSPISIKISGSLAQNVQIYIKKVSTMQIVAQIQLSVNNVNGTMIVIDPTTKKINVTDSAGKITNGYGLTDKTKQSFLYLPQGEYIIGSNMLDTDSGRVEISIKRYLFD